MRRSIVKPILLASLLCGALDILFAMMLTVWRGRAIPDMLRFVASGPFPQAANWGTGGAALGLLVHFTLMTIMVTAFVLGARRIPAMTDNPLLWGLLFGLATYVAMNLIVVPLRFPAAWPPKALSIGTQLFAHVVLVGLPTAFIAKRYLRG